MHDIVTISTPNVDFRVLKQGANPSAVFVHGLGDDLHVWDSLWTALGQTMGEKLSALRYDLRGFGASVCRERVPFKHADDLLTILDATAIDRCDLIGVSMGGSIALNFTLDHPERVRNLVLISPHLMAWEWSESWLQCWQPIVDCARAGAMDEARRLWWEHPLFRTTRASAAGPVLFESIMRFPDEQWLDDRHELMLPDVERLHLLARRTLLLTGGQDLEDFRLIADLIEASATDVRRIDDPARGHLLHLEDPVRCAMRISTFLLS
jgi:pimeloyl-ACP methyl ester carboxylesterase